MRKMTFGSLLVMAFVLLCTGAVAQSMEGGADGADRTMLRGTIGGIIADEHRILMNDVVYALPQVLEFNGEERTAEQVLRKLETGERVRFQSSFENSNGYQTIEVLSTDPQ